MFLKHCRRSWNNSSGSSSLRTYFGHHTSPAWLKEAKKNLCFVSTLRKANRPGWSRPKPGRLYSRWFKPPRTSLVPSKEHHWDVCTEHWEKSSFSRNNIKKMLVPGTFSIFTLCYVIVNLISSGFQQPNKQLTHVSLSSGLLWWVFSTSLDWWID